MVAVSLLTAEEDSHAHIAEYGEEDAANLIEMTGQGRGREKKIAAAGAKSACRWLLLLLPLGRR
jgi:hypothetical protein